MKYENDIKNILLFHIISPVFLLMALISFLGYGSISYALAFISISLLFNLTTLIVTYNSIELTEKSLVVYKGFSKKKISFQYKDIKGIETFGSSLPSFQAYNVIIPLAGLTYDSQRDKFKIHKGYISNENFNKLELELRKKIKNK